ncbi:MAG TPA: LuxR C-terminal-related transcriptional regulator, partial [Iamia sp.]
GRSVPTVAVTVPDVVDLADGADAAIVRRALEALGLTGLEDAIDQGVVEVAADGTLHAREPATALRPSEARAAHQALADAIGPGGPLAVAHRRAVHLAAATLLPDAPVADEVAATAGELRAADRLPDAAALWAEAARLTPERSTRAQRLREAGEALWLLSRFEDAGLVLLEAFAATDDPVVRADVAIILGQIELWTRGPRHALAVQLPTADAVAAIDPDRAAALAVHASHTVIVSHDVPVGLRQAEWAAELAEQGTGALVPAASVARLVALVHAGDRDGVDAAWAPLEELAWSLVDADDVPEVEHLLNALGLVATITERWAVGEAFLERVVFRARNAGSPSMLGMAAGCLAELRFRSGRLEEAMKLFDGEVAEGCTTTGPVPALWLAAVSCRCAVVLDESPNAVRVRASQCLADAEKVDATVAAAWARSALALLDLVAGDAAMAAHHLDRVAAAHAAGEVHEPGLLWWQPDHVEALWRAGRRHEAGVALARLVDDAHRTGRRSAEAGAARCRGLLAATNDEAEVALEEALSTYATLPAPFEVARTLLVRGERRLAAGRNDDAAADVEGATTVFEGLGARPWASRARALRRTVAEARDPLAPLTEAERRVAALVASGARNRAVAEQLFLSERTVEAHLERIYRKLDVANRTELSALVNRRR